MIDFTNVHVWQNEEVLQPSLVHHIVPGDLVVSTFAYFLKAGTTAHVSSLAQIGQTDGMTWISLGCLLASGFKARWRVDDAAVIAFLS